MSTSSSKSGRSRRRLLTLTDGDLVGGAEVNLRFLVPELHRLGIDTTIAAPGGKALETYFRGLDVPIEVAPVLAPYESFRRNGRLSLRSVGSSYLAVRRNAKALERLLDRLKPTWVLSSAMVSHWLLSVVAPRARSRRIGTVMFLQDIVARERALGAYGRGLDWIASRVDHVITISDAVSATLPKGTGVTRLYNPVPFERPSRRKASGGPLRVGLFARYARWKGHGDFLKIAGACASLAMEFVSYGNVPDDERDYFESLLAEASRLKNAPPVRIHEFLPDPQQAMAECDVVLHLSRLPEPFGRVLIEANWAGAPVLAYRGGGVDELFERLALGGELFENGDWQGVVARLKDFRSDRYSIPDLSALTPPVYAERFLEVLDRVAR